MMSGWTPWAHGHKSLEGVGMGVEKQLTKGEEKT
jgi:hypothetical protein